VGEVTSGLFGPSVDAYVGLGYLSASVPVPGRVAVAGDQGGPVECSRRPFFDPDGTRLRA
jgi:glycine cleavage system aminomethyltransferase T